MTARLWADRRGATSLEFALVLPIFLLLLLGIIVYGQYFAIRIAVVHAASEGARASVMGLDEAERHDNATTRVSQVMTGYAPLVTVTASNPQTTAASTSDGSGVFKVTVAYTIPSVGFVNLSSLVPSPDGRISYTATASYGGY